VYGQSRFLPMFPAVLPRRTKIARQEMHLAGGRRASGLHAGKIFSWTATNPASRGNQACGFGVRIHGFA
jgi:hypothetical protein